MTPAAAGNRLRMQERDRIRHSAAQYGMDAVEAVRSHARGQGPGHTVRVHFVPPAPGVARPAIPAGLSADQVIFAGAAGSPSLRVQGLTPEHHAGTADGKAASLLVELAADGPIDGHVYRLRLEGRPEIAPLHAVAEFCFGSRPPFAAPDAPVAAPVKRAPDDLMNKDFASFRRLMLEHLAGAVPSWKERHPADLGVVLVEVLAYVADMLSYYQDAAAAEAFLDTARLRASVVRHGRLLGYRVQPVVAARSWVHLDVEQDRYTLPAHTLLLTQQPHWKVVVDAAALDQTTDVTSPIFFETVCDEALFIEHNMIRPSDFGMASFELRQGATSATLEGALSHLAQGSVLAFEAVPNANLSDATHIPRASWFAHVVRLSASPVVTQTPGGPRTLVRWFAEDALPRAFPVSSAGITTWVRGNMVLIDAGRTLPGKILPTVEKATRYRPPAAQDIAWTVPYDAALESSQAAQRTLKPDTGSARAAVQVRETDPQFVWTAADSLLEQDRFARRFVVEIDDHGMGSLLFGDGDTGRRPDPQTTLTMSARVGCPEHVGAVAIAHIVGQALPVIAVHNPLPIQAAGQEESLERIRILAPSFALERQLAVLADDFILLVKRHPAVLDAVAEGQGGGLERRMAISLQLHAGKDLTAGLRAEILGFLQTGLLVGQAVRLRLASRLAVQVWVQIRTSSLNPDPTLARAIAAVHAFFAEGNFHFGEPAARSRLTEHLMLVPGILDLRFERFCTAGAAGADLLQNVLRPGPRHILKLFREAALPDSLRVLSMRGSL